MAFSWQYADWRSRTYSTDEARYDRLVLHIEEVSNKTIEIESRSRTGGFRQGQVLQSYLDTLQSEASKLLRRLETASYRHGGVVRVHTRAL